MTGSQQPTVESAGDETTTNTEINTPMTTETTAETVEAISTDAAADPVSKREVEEDNQDEDEEADTAKPDVDRLPTSCDECGNDSLTKSEKHAEITCDDCGAIVESRDFPQTAGWKRHAVKTHERDTSVTANDDSGISMNALGGTIDWKDMDGYGSSLSSLKRSQMHRLRQLDRSLDTGNAKTSNYKYALGEINRIAADIDAPRHVRDAASEMYERILEDDALTGRAIEAVATAVLYAACEEKNISRDLAELSAVSHADHVEIADTYESLVRELGLSDYGVGLTSHVPALCEALDLDDTVAEIAADILRGTVTEEHLENGSLMEHTAAAVYAAAVRTGTVLSQQRIADTADVPQNAVRTRYQEQLETIGL